MRISLSYLLLYESGKKIGGPFFFSQLTLPFGHLDEGHFWMLHFVHLSLTEIEYPVCFNFSGVYAFVFVDSQISTY